MPISHNGKVLRKITKTMKGKKSNGGAKVEWMKTVAGRAVKRAAQVRMEQLDPDVLTTGQFNKKEVGEYLDGRMKKFPEFLDIRLDCLKSWPMDKDRWENIGQRGFIGFYENKEKGEARFMHSVEHYTRCAALRDPDVIKLADKLLKFRANKY